MSATNGLLWTQVFQKSDGTPYSGVRAFHYVAGGTTVNLDVYIDGAMTTPAANPVLGDTAGRVTFYGNNTYRLLIKSSVADGDLTLYDWDPVEIIHQTATLRAEDRGTSLPAASSTGRGRLFATTNAGGDVTAMAVQRTAAAWMSFLTLPTLASMLEFAKGTTIASTTSATIPSDGNFFDVTGNTTIETFSGFTGYPVIYTRTLSTLTFTHSSNLVLLGSANRTTLANQITAWLHIGAGQWAELWYTAPWFGDGTFIDGGVLCGNGQGAFTDIALPTIHSILGHSGTVGQDPFWLTGLSYQGPTGVGTGSTRSHEGSATIGTNQNLSGVHYYTTFTLAAGVTLTVPTGKKRLVIAAAHAITINGTINASGSGGLGGLLAVHSGGPRAAQSGTDQPGGGGNGTTPLGGDVTVHGSVLIAGGSLGVSGTPLVGSDVATGLYGGVMGGGGGGAGDGVFGANGVDGAGGNGGGSIVLIAPTITLAATAVLNTSGTAGGSNTLGGGGGGGAGNVYVYTRNFTDNGAVFTAVGGSGGFGGGAAGAPGVKQINLFA